MSVRLVAAEVLTAARTADAWVGEVLDRHIRDSQLSPQDRRLVTQIVLGVVRRRATLDTLVRPFVTRPFHEVQEPLVDLLRVGAYQLVFLTHVPRHAAVHETVDATLPAARGFVNAILRRVSDAVTD